MTARAIRATFSDWRTVKGRKALQLIFEVPLEQQAEVLTMLGAPMPDNPAWCGIARLADEPVPEPAKNPDRSDRAREAYALKDDMAKAATRAAMLCKEKRFQDWLFYEMAGGSPIHAGLRPEENARHILCTEIGIASRSQIASDERTYQAFLALETSYKQAVGLMAEPR